MEKLGRPKTANLSSFQYATDLAARNTLQQPQRQRPGSQRSTADSWEARGRLLGWRQSPQANGGLARSVEIQRNFWTDPDPPNYEYGECQNAYEMVGRGYPEEPVADEAEWQLYQLPGYHGLPVMQPLKVMNPYGRTVVTGSLAPPGARAPASHCTPFNRAGRNGSNWRHVTQCTGNLGNHIVFIDGHVKASDSQRFPPYGYPAGFGPGAQAVPCAAAAAVASPLRRQPSAAGRLGTAGSRSGGGGLYNSRALERARAGNKYWFEERRPNTLTPNTIQGRIMKSGTAY